MFNTNKKIILIIILILGVFVMPNNFIKNIIENANGQIKYKETYVTGEITVDNGDGTYDVKINNASDAYKNVETRDYDAIFSVGEIVDIGYEYGTKESPKILGHSKKIKQEPKQVEVDYSGGCAGVQTVTVTINSIDAKNGYLEKDNADYDTAHDAAIADFISPSAFLGWIGQYGITGEDIHKIQRTYLYFDASSIPINAKVTGGILKLFVNNIDVEIDFDVIIQDGQPDYPSSTLQKSDYNYVLYKNNGGSINTGSMTPMQYNLITLNTNGINWINCGGITKFILVSSQDRDKTNHTIQYINFIEIVLVEDDYKPKLTITYEI